MNRFKAVQRTSQTNMEHLPQILGTLTFRGAFIGGAYLFVHLLQQQIAGPPPTQLLFRDSATPVLFYEQCLFLLFH